MVQEMMMGVPQHEMNRAMQEGRMMGAQQHEMNRAMQEERRMGFRLHNDVAMGNIMAGHYDTEMAFMPHQQGEAMPHQQSAMLRFQEAVHEDLCRMSAADTPDSQISPEQQSEMAARRHSVHNYHAANIHADEADAALHSAAVHSQFTRDAVDQMTTLTDDDLTLTRDDVAAALDDHLTHHVVPQSVQIALDREAALAELRGAPHSVAQAQLDAAAASTLRAQERIEQQTTPTPATHHHGNLHTFFLH